MRVKVFNLKIFIQIYIYIYVYVYNYKNFFVNLFELYG